MTPAAVIFDFDGTIVDTEWPAYESAREVHEEHGVDLTIDAWAVRLGRADNPHWAELLIPDRVTPAALDAVDLARRDRKNALTDLAPVREGVCELVEAAAVAGARLAVASSSPRYWVDRHLARVGLSDRFEVVCTRDDVAKAKPWPDVFLLAAERLGVDPVDCLVVEDSHHGLAAALSAGMTCVVVPHPVSAAQDFSGATAVLASLLDLPDAYFGDLRHGDGEPPAR